MALALLKVNHTAADPIALEAQLGSNRYYQYAIGETVERGPYGVDQIVDPLYLSNVVGPLNEASLGRVTFNLNTSDWAESENRRRSTRRFVQLTSFRDRQRRGPTVSEVVPLPSVSTANLPNISFSLNTSGDRKMMQTPLQALPTHGSLPVDERVRVKAFGYKRRTYSQAQFLQSLLPMLTRILPQVGQTVTQALPIVRDAVARAGNNSQASAPWLDILQQLAQLLGGANGASSAAAANASAAQSVMAPYAQAQALPLAALLPLLTQVLTPETVQGVLNMPNQHMQTMLNGLKDLGRLGIESHEQDLRHLREIHPSLEDSELTQLLMSMSASVRQSPVPKYRRVSSVELTMLNKSVLINGEQKSLYALNKTDWLFPFHVNTPREISQATVYVELQDKQTLKALRTSQYTIGDVRSGQLIDQAKITLQQQASLKAKGDYLATIHLVWRNRAGELRGTSRQHLVTPMNEAVFDRIEEGGELIPLDDPSRFQPFWHKVWHDRFTREISQHVIELRYYLQFDATDQPMARFESQARFKTENRQKHGQLRTGAEWTLATLNQLRRTLRSYAPALTDAEQKALEHVEFKQRFGTVAHRRVDMRATNGKLGEVWVFPVVQMQSVVLKVPQTVNQYGQVTALFEQVTELPIPVQVHYVGFKS